jgi:signal transduction histidine kinase
MATWGKFRNFLAGRSRSRAAGYGFSFLVSLIGIVVTAKLRPVLQVAVLPPLIGVSLLAAWCGGRGPGLFSVFVTSVGASFLLFEPVGAFGLDDPRDISEFTIFAIVSITVVLMTASLRNTRDRVERRSKELEVALKEMEEFTYAMAHNLRAPLRGMAGFSQILKEDQAARLDEEGRQSLDRIIRSSKFMDILLQGLLAYAALSRVEIQPATVDVGEVLDEALEGIAGETQRRGARIEKGAGLSKVVAQTDLLRQVFTTLLMNAITFVAPGTVPVVRITTVAKAGWERICIEDNGIGIDARHQSRIFSLFERLHPERYPGTGLGLALARRTVERMGGKIGVDSEPGKGSCFWIELPAPHNLHPERYS